MKDERGGSAMQRREFEKGKETKEPAAPANFIDTIIEEHNRTGKYGGRVQTRFPPEPNGYLHVGHAKSICLNFGLALKYGGKCHLRMDDTNPLKEETQDIEALKEDVPRLGFQWARPRYHPPV